MDAEMVKTDVVANAAVVTGPTVEQLKAELEALKAKLAAPVVVVAAPPMSIEEAKAFVAKFEGKRGRRPAAFFEAQKIAGTVSPEEAKAKKMAAKAEVKSKAALKKLTTAANKAQKVAAKAAASARKVEKRHTKALKTEAETAEIAVNLLTQLNALTGVEGA
jgi:cell division septum initiation protein DivIVA